MKKVFLLVLLLVSCSAVPVQFLMQKSEVAPRGDVNFIYSPQEFNPSQLMLKFTSGSEIHEPEIPFNISSGDPVVVDNGVFKFSVSSSDHAQIIVGTAVVDIVPEVYDGASHLPAGSSVQVFPGSKMTYLIWTPINSTYTVHRIARIWYNKPWVEIETLVSSSAGNDIDFREHLNNLNVGTGNLDNLTIPLKSGIYEITPSDGVYIPTEGWMVAWDGENALGMGLEAEQWDLQITGSYMNFVTHQPVSLLAGVQSKTKSYYYIMSHSTDMRSDYLRFRGGAKYRFSTVNDWTSGTVGKIEDRRRDENATFYLPAPPINATLASLGLEIGTVSGSSPNLECTINGYKFLEQDVSNPILITREIPAYWLKFENNTVVCFADGGDIIVTNIWLTLASVDGVNLIYGGESWQYSSVNLWVNQTSAARIDLDMRDLGITRDASTVIAFDSNLRRIYSTYTYPILSFNSSLLANITNTFLVSYGDGEVLEFSAPKASGSFTDYSSEVVSSGSFGAGILERDIHEESRIAKKEVPQGAQTGGGKTMLYDGGLGAILRLVIWR